MGSTGWVAAHAATYTYRIHATSLSRGSIGTALHLVYGCGAGCGVGVGVCFLILGGGGRIVVPLASALLVSQPAESARQQDKNARLCKNKRGALRLEFIIVSNTDCSS
jgi:hypothetical protein